jgi:hypothetical protein
VVAPQGLQWFCRLHGGEMRSHIILQWETFGTYLSSGLESRAASENNIGDYQKCNAIPYSV